VGPAIVLAAVLAGCGGTSGTSSPSASAAAGSGATSGMDMRATSTPDSGMSVNGIKPIPMRQLASSTWQGMKIIAQEGTAVPFIVFDGTREHMIKPGPKTSFHLMVMLNDAHTGVAIPYATVWATIRKQGKVVYDERQWPMISAFMGPHYGNDVSLPGAGSYQLSLLISPPVSARHVEYQHVWLTPHQVNMTINWQPIS
jgi:Fe2+ transport protein